MGAGWSTGVLVDRPDDRVDEPQEPSADLAQLQPEAIDELTRRIEAIEKAYRALAEQVGHLYLSADEYRLDGLTAQLDQPMRNASENEQTFAALLDELRLLKRRRSVG